MASRKPFMRRLRSPSSLLFLALIQTRRRALEHGGLRVGQGDGPEALADR